MVFGENIQQGGLDERADGKSQALCCDRSFWNDTAFAGMQTAENIIAVNSDAEAQIFKVADFGIVGDLFEIVPAMIKSVKGEGVKGEG